MFDKFTLALGGACLLVSAVSGAIAPEEETKLAANVALAPKPAKAARALVLSKCFGYVHKDGIEFGKRTFELMAEKGLCRAEFIDDVSRLAAKDGLKDFDVLVLNNCTGIKAKDFPGLEAALCDFVKRGGGLCVIHSGDDGFYDSEAISDLIGGRFWGHPWHAKGQWRFRNEAPDHPVNAPFAAMKGPLVFSDEIYQQSSPAYSRDKVKVLVSIDLSDAATAAALGRWKNGIREDRDFAVSWMRDYGQGKVFYTSFAHDRRAFLDPVLCEHIVRGFLATGR